MGSARSGLAVVTFVLGSTACARTMQPLSAEPTNVSRTFGFAFDPRPCRAGTNTISAAVFIAGEGNKVRYMTPADGHFNAALLEEDGSTSPVEVRWLTAPSEHVNLTPPAIAWNAELYFESMRTGACPVRIEIQPSKEARKQGLVPAVTTILLQALPAPPATPE